MTASEVSRTLVILLWYQTLVADFVIKHSTIKSSFDASNRGNRFVHIATLRY